MEFAIRIHPTQPHTRGTPAITPACRRSRVESGAEYERSVRDPAIPHRVVEFIGVERASRYGPGRALRFAIIVESAAFEESVFSCVFLRYMYMSVNVPGCVAPSWDLRREASLSGVSPWEFGPPTTYSETRCGDTRNSLSVLRSSLLSRQGGRHHSHRRSRRRGGRPRPGRPSSHCAICYSRGTPTAEASRGA